MGEHCLKEQWQLITHTGAAATTTNHHNHQPRLLQSAEDYFDAQTKTEKQQTKCWNYFNFNIQLVGNSNSLFELMGNSNSPFESHVQGARSQYVKAVIL